MHDTIMTETTRTRLYQDIDKVMQNLTDAWSKAEMPKLVKQFKKAISADAKSMPTRKYCVVINAICNLYGMVGVWNERTKIFYLKVQNASCVYSDETCGVGQCKITYYAEYPLSMVQHDIYNLIADTKEMFISKYEGMPEFAESIKTIKETM